MSFDSVDSVIITSLSSKSFVQESNNLTYLIVAKSQECLDYDETIQICPELTFLLNIIIY
jgi:hypothetical protein